MAGLEGEVVFLPGTSERGKRGRGGDRSGDVVDESNGQIANCWAIRLGVTGALIGGGGMKGHGPEARVVKPASACGSADSTVSLRAMRNGGAWARGFVQLG